MVTNIIIGISAGCGVVCNAAVVIAMVTTYVCFRKRKKSGYNIGVQYWMFIVRHIYSSH